MKEDKKNINNYQNNEVDCKRKSEDNEIEENVDKKRLNIKLVDIPELLDKEVNLVC